MSDVPIDVDAQIENLRGLKSDLEACYLGVVEAGEPGMRFALGIAVNQLGQRILALEEVVRHHGADEILLGHLSLDEYRSVERALETLDGELTLEKDMRPTKLWSRVRAVAVRRRRSPVRGGAREQRAGADEEDRPRRPRVVLPLVRSRLTRLATTTRDEPALSWRPASASCAVRGLQRAARRVACTHHFPVGAHTGSSAGASR